MAPRNSDILNTIPSYLDAGDVKASDIQKFVEESLGKLPEKYRTGSYGMDIMPFKRPDGSVAYKIVEMNPAERAYNNLSGYNAGGGSGFLDSRIVPYVGHAQYRAMTVVGSSK